jgi:5-methylcytosine-specific restriction endonuclease McrA
MRYEKLHSDPVLVRSGFRCTYCNRDLLGDVDALVSITRDHVVARWVGGGDGPSNRVACCSTCDKLKRDAVVGDVIEARRLVALKRAEHLVWLARIRRKVGWEPCSPRHETPGLTRKP